MNRVDQALALLGAGSALVILVPGLIAALRRRLRRAPTWPTIEQRCDAEGWRFARGEIDVDELERRLERLLEGKPAVEPVRVPGSMSMAEMAAGLAALTNAGVAPAVAAKRMRRSTPLRTRGALTPARTPSEPPASARLVPLRPDHDLLRGCKCASCERKRDEPMFDMPQMEEL